MEIGNSFNLTLKRKVRVVLPEFCSITIFIVVWHLISQSFPHFLLPSPASTLQETFETLFSSDFIFNAMLTLKRAFTGLLTAFFLSNVIALVSSRYIYAKKFFWPLLVLALSLPPIILTFAAIVILGSRGPIATIVVTTVLIPPLLLILFPAYKNLDEELIEMARVFRISKTSYIKNFAIPQLSPFLFSAIRTGISDAWKLTILTEVFSLGNGVGNRILHYFNLFSIREVFAWAAAFLLIIFLIEYGIVQQLENKFTFRKGLVNQ